MAEQVPPRWREKILHATLTVGDNVLMGSDPVPEQYEQPKGFAVLLGIDDPVDAERIFHGLAENGTVQMPSRKPSGPSALACLSINSAYPGRSTASKRLA
jgi:uncharacterized glyoxalase superfamily protein PhnB